MVHIVAEPTATDAQQRPERRLLGTVRVHGAKRFATRRGEPVVYLVYREAAA